MSTARITTSACIILVLLFFMTVGCQSSFGTQPAATPQPVPPLPPQLTAKGLTDQDSKVIDGHLHVQYMPSCELMSAPATVVAPIRLTDLRSGSYVFLNRNGTVVTRYTPVYKTEQAQDTLEAVLEDSSLISQIVARPACPDKVTNPKVQQQDGWPDVYEEGIGDPPMPKVAIGVSPMSIATPPRNVHPGWIGAYCWPVSGSVRKCEDTVTWNGFGAAKALESGRIYVIVLGDDASPGTVRRVSVFPAQTKWSVRKLGRVLHLGVEVHRVVATSGETLDKFVLPKLPEGDYLLITKYESPVGEIEHGFKVNVPSNRKN